MPGADAEMGFVLGANRYGKAETRLLRVTRDEDMHEIRDLNVSISLYGDFSAIHLAGDNSNLVPTDTQKNTVYAFAKEAPIGAIEEFGLRLGRHFVDDFEPVTRSQVRIDEYPWTRIEAGGTPHPHSFVRGSAEKRLATITCDQERAWVVAGLTDLVVLKSAGSEFRGYLKDPYTTLRETSDRVLATAVTATWRFSHLGVDWETSFTEARRQLLNAFAATHSSSLQQTLYAMGKAVLQSRPEIAEVRMSMPNKHHFCVDLTPFGLANDNEVFYAADRPYGLIEGAVLREDAPEQGLAWLSW